MRGSTAEQREGGIEERVSVIFSVLFPEIVTDDSIGLVGVDCSDECPLSSSLSSLEWTLMDILDNGKIIIQSMHVIQYIQSTDTSQADHPET